MESLKRIELKHKLFIQLLSINQYDETIKYCSEFIKKNEKQEVDTLSKCIGEYCKDQISLHNKKESLFDTTDDTKVDLFEMLNDNILGYIIYEKKLLENNK